MTRKVRSQVTFHMRALFQDYRSSRKSTYSNMRSACIIHGSDGGKRNHGPSEVAAIVLASCLSRLFLFFPLPGPYRPYHFCTWHILFLLDRRNNLKVEREHSHRFGLYQRNDSEMFSHVSLKVMAQPPSANRKKQYEIHNVLGTGPFGSVMVRMRVSRVYTP